jgi:hypothetical protein
MNFSAVVSSLVFLAQELTEGYPSRTLLERPQDVLQTIVDNSRPGAMHSVYANSAANVFFTAIALNDMALLERATVDLSNYCADQHNFDRPHESCLQLAVQSDNVKAAELLVRSHQVRMKLQDALKIVEGKPAFEEVLFQSGWMLAEAVEAKDMDLVQRSLADPSNSVDYWRNNFYPPLFSAIWNNDYEMVKLLIAHGTATSYVKFGRTVTALSAAITRNNYRNCKCNPANRQIIEYLVHSRDFSPNEPFEYEIDREKFLMTPLAYAIKMNNADLFDLLVECGAATSGFGYTQLERDSRYDARLDPKDPKNTLTVEQVAERAYFTHALDFFTLRKIKPIFEAFIERLLSLPGPKLPAEIIMGFLMPMILQQDGYKLSKAGMVELEDYAADLLGLDQVVAESELE